MHFDRAAKQQKNKAVMKISAGFANGICMRMVMPTLFQAPISIYRGKRFKLRLRASINSSPSTTAKGSQCVRPRSLHG
jgi:hypothetical protein